MASTKFTPEARAALLERFAAGLTVADAAAAEGLNRFTVRDWIAKGRRESSGPYTEFAAAVDDARREARERVEPMDHDELLRVVSEAARKGSVQAMKLRWEMICAERADEETAEPTEEDALAEVYELAEARRA